MAAEAVEVISAYDRLHARYQPFVAETIKPFTNGGPSRSPDRAQVTHRQQQHRDQSCEASKIFVSDEKTNNVAVLDPETHEVMKFIDTSRRPRDMRFNTDQTLLYVACGNDDVIDVATLEVVDHIPTGPSSEVFNFSPEGSTIYVSNENNSTLQMVAVAASIIIDEVSTGAEPEGVAVSEDGTTAYVTSEVSDMVHVIDIASASVTDNIIVGTRPRRLVMMSTSTEPGPAIGAEKGV